MSWYDPDSSAAYSQVFQGMLEVLGHGQQRVLLDTVKSVSDYLHNRNDPVGSTACHMATRQH